ncbi:hypothetical protein HMPREF9371_1693 [Neisseria shayeganii 871]|uniref:Uncharacterized protein n=1 Tax=Neisseria shayeganii 871 TaxID=1032488 RepID=G4CJA4_9NEIS|nr:hypothetical protein HMPREF9371_1693 [Neisseria shayeganii 871]
MCGHRFQVARTLAENKPKPPAMLFARGFFFKPPHRIALRSGYLNTPHAILPQLHRLPPVCPILPPRSLPCRP